MKAFNDQKIAFIARAKENRKFVELESFIGANQDLDLGESTLFRDCKVQLYTGLTVNNKRVTSISGKCCQMGISAWLWLKAKHRRARHFGF